MIIIQHISGETPKIDAVRVRDGYGADYLRAAKKMFRRPASLSVMFDPATDARDLGKPGTHLHIWRGGKSVAVVEIA